MRLLHESHFTDMLRLTLKRMLQEYQGKAYSMGHLARCRFWRYNT